MEAHVSEKSKSVLDFISWCEDLESRLEKLEDNGDIIIDSDEVSFNQDPLLSSGDNKKRSHTVKIKYNKEFRKVLEVIPSIQRIDTDCDYNSRFDIKVEHITNTGFDLLIGTWRPTIIREIRIKWYAVGHAQISSK